MILLSSAVRIYVAVEPVTMRRSFDGLMAQVRSVLAQDPLSGHVFAFINRRRNQVKLLMWTRGGLTIVHKRLEVGTFTIVERLRSDATHVELGAHELSMLLEGIDATRARIAPRWSPPSSSIALQP
jgi:transposase